MRPILFVSDFGLEDEFVGVCHAVIARLAPGATVVDISHAVAPGDVLRGGMALAEAASHGPEDAVLLGVVDPEVGSKRRPVAVEAGKISLVGPDNGLLAHAWNSLGGADRAVVMDDQGVSAGAISATFHGRDLFAPAAAMLAAGAALEDLGSRIDPSSLTLVEPPSPEIEDRRIACEVLRIDRFGNVELSVRRADLNAARIDPGRAYIEMGERRHPLVHRRTFAEIGSGELGLIEDSSGWLAVVRNRHSTAEMLGLRPGDRVLLSSPPWDSASS